ncbi:MaoC/PaaZ C-terminal domain-containing protein [Longispora sp. K20-0274]|uniref:MaoC family dehydratase n=1 Tax=Longispora sp. K20-0274 TaxID=3088255 RepID=UPI00399B8980
MSSGDLGSSAKSASAPRSAVSVLRALATVTHRGDTLPAAELGREVTVDRTALAAYAKVCGFRVADTLPATYPHVLSFPLQMELLTRSDFPFPVLGLVHVANRITVHRPVSASETLALTVRAEDLRPHDKGRQFDVVSEARVGDELVWQDWSTYLRRSGSSSSDGAGERPEPPRPSAQWRVPADIGRRYAAVSGDSNPIHLYALTARAFGFPRAIAHGMWTKARCLAALEGRLPEAYTVEVRFKLPVLLPAKVGFSSDGGAFAVHDVRTGKPHLSGTVA